MQAMPTKGHNFQEGESCLNFSKATGCNHRNGEKSLG